MIWFVFQYFYFVVIVNVFSVGIGYCYFFCFQGVQNSLFFIDIESFIGVGEYDGVFVFCYFYISDKVFVMVMFRWIVFIVFVESVQQVYWVVVIKMIVFGGFIYDLCYIYVVGRGFIEIVVNLFVFGLFC